ncbi:MAG: UDP-2,3-diacylglucosamine diphosphatase LpxI domain-containing protein, partial [Alphaproteobacteria bacterium]
RALGAFDVAQGAVVCDGLVLAVEAAEGTDAMLARVATLSSDLRGHEGALRGVLVKVTKPAQDRQIDQPTIGPATILNAHKAGLAGVAIEAEHGLIVDREETIATADRLGLFIFGLDIADYEQA